MNKIHRIFTILESLNINMNELPVYKKRLGLFRNPKVLKEIRELNPATHHQRIVQLIVGYEFPFDVTRALELALFHTFSSPSISSLLARTGQFERYGQKRYDDTSLLISRFMQDGIESPTGNRAVEHINHIHSHYNIANEDFLFVLSTFITYPINWINKFGWRKLSLHEELAFFNFFIAVGGKMEIKNLPVTMHQLLKFVEEYEAKHLEFKESNKKIADSTVQVVAHWFPKILTPLIKPAFSTLIPDKLRKAFGYKLPGFLFSSTLKGLLLLRKIPLRWITFKPYPTLIENTKYRNYPNGIPEIEETGPKGVIGGDK